jgi:deazaflavin-dependent oxidoreductase (nitroreductase family)
MDEAVTHALATDRLVDITTTGRQSGEPRRLETWLYRADGTLYLTGRPGKRGWYANIVANPSFVLHIKASATADLPATGRPITGAAERRAILTSIVEARNAELVAAGSEAMDVESWISGSPLIEISLAGSDS